ncbi:MBL fold metallo-hydrolase [Peptoniphilus sp. MSJ-1]|uniref:MBL fold metallo-hydrolase n=1 Tax=Peptoniphilus ovalis TaxID=2841503 RepID=A0ABS6FEE6_9FIRM|nr:MBL fold metallo-hydrolase [Peptoniphilus ovalis]MBU5668558.1 MBL fold metallo-hydrolase [Peptoniphilus ovalis]
MSEIKKLQDGIYCKIIPLKGNPLKSINIYMVKSKGEAMIIDTGFDTEEIRKEMMDYIKDMDIDLNKTILYLTHLHSDHTGLSSWFAEDLGVDVYISDVDYQMVSAMASADSKRWKDVMEIAHMQGLDEDNLKIEEHSGYRYRPKRDFKHKSLNPGDILKVGDFTFKGLDFAGHTPGMVGLYEEDKKILFCGDHILKKITPNITFWNFETGDSLGTYLKNIEKLRDLQIEHLYSSHRELIDDVPARIDELKRHHAHRIDEALKTLEKHNECTVRDVAVGMHWDISARGFNDFPNTQKFFAAGEAHAHLEHLRAIGKADFRKDENGVLKYFKI